LKSENGCEKVTVTGDGKNNSGSITGAEPPAAGGYEGLGVEPPTLQQFFQKIKHFYAYFGLKFSLKACF